MPVCPRLLTRLAFVVFLACNGCAYHGAASTDIDNPAVQKFAWFSFLDGHDIREACASLGAQGSAGVPAHYRLVYNGQYSKQIRAYEIVGQRGLKKRLTQREVMLLRLLTERAGEVVSREEILQKVWGYDVFPTTRTIDNFIVSFRKYFEVDPQSPKHFRSIRGVGYTFVD